ncbi:hypothetical protein I302_103187 [Kwoniella bestiolae CBS 10118]|uniref:N-acetyltransferase domain-containing protein n=1 Tax=Kwoniella bestiolae CBS 10118 TaxID=1296100 RepID=A0A1B9G7T9_9TREE|nr:hypothetical protein I302_01885 [Kwoniella bestiolae CBS 10118]OCF27050.1 hypothetical protein I302_01885 [Kwoniella bestiolae CBS 10118]
MSCPVKKSDKGEPYIPLILPSHPDDDIRLTPWKEDDLDDIIELFNLPNVEKWGRSRPSPFTQSHAAELIPEIQSHLPFLLSLVSSHPNPPDLSTYPKQRVRLSPLGALRDTHGKIIGTLGFKTPSEPGSGGEWEVTYNLHDGYAGRGIGGAMVRVAVQWGRWLRIRRLIAHTEADNFASNRVLSKNGFFIRSERAVEWPEHRGGGRRDTYEWYRALDNPDP